LGSTGPGSQAGGRAWAGFVGTLLGASWECRWPTHPADGLMSACAVTRHSSEGGAVLRCEKWCVVRAIWRPSPGSEQKQKQAAESGAALHAFIYELHRALISRSLSFVACSYPATQPPPDSPLNVALICLPCLFLSSSRFPCKRTNKKKSSAFKSARSFSLPCSYSPPLQTNKQQAEFSLSKRPFLSVAVFLFAPRCRSRRGRPADSPPPSQISAVFIFALL
jgi:hypothetical protein